jgi:NADH dehydrogenase/NADH:ubiquinone oxidoreductase subunit G
MNELRSALGIADQSAQTSAGLVVRASATCTLEEMYVLKQFAAACSGAEYFVARHVADGEEDELLRRADRHPNAKGAELLGIPVVDFREDSDQAPIEVPQKSVLFAVGFDYAIGAPLEEFFGRFAGVAVVSSRDTSLTRMASVVLPGLTFAEKEGLIVNFEGHIQQLSPALDNLWDRTPPWELVADLMSSMTGESPFASIAGLRTALGREAVFSAVNLNAVGSTGIRLTTQAV